MAQLYAGQLELLSPPNGGRVDNIVFKVRAYTDAPDPFVKIELWWYNENGNLMRDWRRFQIQSGKTEIVEWNWFQNNPYRPPAGTIIYWKAKLLNRTCKDLWGWIKCWWDLIVESEEQSFQYSSCIEGETICMGMDLYQCINGTWQLVERNSQECGYQPPEYVNEYEYLQMLPEIDSSEFPDAPDWQGIIGYWYINRDNNRLIYQHPEKVKGYYWLIDLHPDKSNVKFWQSTNGGWIRITQLPVEVAEKSIEMLSIPYQNIPPVADFTWQPETPLVGEEVTFDGTLSYDPDGEIYGYNWDFGDGNWTAGPNGIVKHTYKQAGEYTVALTVEDMLGGMATIEKTIRVITEEEEEEKKSYAFPLLAGLIIATGLVVYKK